MSVALQLHHQISKNLSRQDPLLKVLTLNGLYDVEGSSNTIFLPQTQELAATLGVGLPNGSLSPHPGGPLSSYETGVEQFLSGLREDNSLLFVQAQAGDATALSFFSSQVETFNNAVKVAFQQGAVFTNAPVAGQAVADAANANFFANLPAFIANNTTAINAVRAVNALGGDAANFAVFTTDFQLRSALAFTQQNGLKISANIPYSAAIDNDASLLVPAELSRYMNHSGLSLALKSDSAALSAALSNVGRAFGVGFAGLTIAGDAVSAYSAARQVGESVGSADLAAGERVAVDIAVTGLLAGAAAAFGAAPVAAAVVTLAACVVVAEVTASAWQYVATPLSQLGSALSTGDLAGAITAAEAVLTAIEQWGLEVVLPAARGLAVNVNAFIADPGDYIAQTAQTLWTETKDSLAAAVSGSKQLAGENAALVASVIQGPVANALNNSAHGLATALGTSASTVVSALTAEVTLLKSSQQSLGAVLIDDAGQVTISLQTQNGVTVAVDELGSAGAGAQPASPATGPSPALAALATLDALSSAASAAPSGGTGAGGGAASQPGPSTPALGSPGPDGPAGPPAPFRAVPVFTPPDFKALTAGQTITILDGNGNTIYFHLDNIHPDGRGGLTGDLTANYRDGTPFQPVQHDPTFYGLDEGTDSSHLEYRLTVGGDLTVVADATGGGSEIKFDDLVVCGLQEGPTPDTLVGETSQGSAVLELNQAGLVQDAVFHPADGGVMTKVRLGSADVQVTDAQNGSPPDVQETAPDGTSNDFSAGQIGSLFGSTLGNLLVHGNSLAAIPVTTALSASLSTIFSFLQASTDPSADYAKLIAQAGRGLPSNVASLGTSAVASYLTGQLLATIGIKGDIARAADTAAGSVVGQIAANEVLLAQGVTTVSNSAGQQVTLAWDTNVTSSLVNAAAGFIGSEAGSAVLPASNADGALGGSVASTVGSIIGAYVGGPFGAGVGSFFGELVGTVIGDAIGGVPSPQAWVVITAHPGGPSGTLFSVTMNYSKDEGPVQLVDAAAGSTVTALNGILSTIGGQVVNASGVQPFQFGVRREIPSYRTTSLGADYHFNDLARLESFSALTALQQIVKGGGIAGGDVFEKRALYGFLASSLNNSYDPLTRSQDDASGLVTGDVGTLAGELQIAADYERYLAQQGVIRALIQADPNSAFAAGWAATLAEADALGLDRRATSDWTGGWGEYLNGLGVDAEQLSVSLLNTVRSISAGGVSSLDTIASDQKDVITDATAGDTISIDPNGTLQADANADFNGAAATAANTSQVAAVVYAPLGNSRVYAGGQGDDVVGWTATGAGNEYLAAGSLVNGQFVQSLNATWLFAGAGNDTLQGGASGGDMLQAGAGNDVLIAGSGSTLFVGGSGNDTMIGSNSGDVYQISAGSHTTLIEAGSGSDIIVFGYGDGAATVTNAGGANDELSLGPGIGFQNIQLVRPLVAGTSTPSNNLELELLGPGQAPTGDEITLVNWFLPQNRVQWLRFDDGTKVQLGDFNIVFGTAANNNLLGVPGNNWLVAGPGYATIDAWLGGGILDAGVGQDWISGGAGNDTILGATGDDTLFGGFGGNDYIQGGAGSDILIASPGADTLVAGTGGDTIFGGGGNDLFEYGRGDGQDVLMNPLTAGTVVWNASGWTDGYGWQHFATGAADGGGYDAVTNGTNTIIDTRDFGVNANGLNGYLEYDRTAQLLYYWSPSAAAAEGAGPGSSTLSFGPDITAANLVFQWSGADLLVGVRQDGDLSTPLSQLSDTLRFADYLSQGSDIKTLQFSNDTTLSLSGVVAATSDAAQAVAGGPGATLVDGGAGNDTLTGVAAAETIVGGGGNNLIVDTVTGGAFLTAGNGNDTFLAGPGNDTVAGGGGNNTVSFADAPGPVLAVLAQGGVPGWTESGWAAGDSFSNVEAVIGSAFADTLVGGNNGLDFDAGAAAGASDLLEGGTGDDIYRVHAVGADTINDQSGNNELILDQGQKFSDLYFSAASQGAAAGKALLINDQPGSAASPVGAHYTIDGQFAGSGQGAGPGLIAQIYTADGRAAPLGGIVLNGTATGAGAALVVGDVEVSGVYSPIHTLRANAGNDYLIGTSADAATGDNGNDTLIGGAGNDTFQGGGGSNVIQGGTGANTVVYADDPGAVSVNLLTGTAVNGYGGADVLSNVQNVLGSAFADTIFGGSTGGMLQAGNGAAYIHGGLGNDTLVGGTGADTLVAGAGNDLIRADAGNGLADASTHILIGGAGNDTIFGASTAGDQITAGPGNSLVYGGPGRDTIVGGAGNDTIYSGPGGSVVSTGSGNALVEGGSSNDVITAGAGADTLDGAGGQNILYAGSGSDELINSSGNDTLVGGAGRDTFVVDAQSGSTTIYATQGVDDLVLQDGQASQPLSISRIWLAQSGSDLVVSVIGATAQVTIRDFFGNGTTFPPVRRIVAGDQELFLDKALSPISSTLPAVVQLMAQYEAQDGISLDSRGVPTSMPVQVTDLQSYVWFSTSGPAADSLLGAAGSDTIVGGNSNNLIQGGAGGHNLLTAGPADDTLEGAAGSSTLIGGAGADSIQALGGGNVVLGGSGADTIRGDQAVLASAAGDWLDGGSGTSLILGGTGSNVLLGGAGNDTLVADGYATTPTGDGPDTLIAGAGNQVLAGGRSANVFLSGQGNDSLIGNGGSNTFYIDGFGADTILGSIVPGATNTVNYSLAPGPIWVDLRFGAGLNNGSFNSAWSTGDVLQNITHVVGSSFGGVIGGSNGSDFLQATAGNTYINAFGSTQGPGDPNNWGGQDTLEAGTGDDTLIGGNGGDLLIGGSGDDSIVGGAGNDTLVAGTGNDYLQGGLGSDIYVLGDNFGNDTINNYDTVSSDVDSLSFLNAMTGNVSYDHLWFRQSGNNLLISVIDGTGLLTVENWFLETAAGQSNDFQISFIYAGGMYTKNVNVAGLVSLMSGYSQPANGGALQAFLSANPHYKTQLDLLWQVNHAPTISGPSSASGTEDQPFTFVLHTGDVDQGPTGLILTAASSSTSLTDPNDTVAGDTYSGLPQFTASQPDANGNVTVTLIGKRYQHGTANVTFTVTDLDGATGSVVVPVSIAGINYPPTVTPIASQSIAGNTTDTIFFTANDVETPNGLTVTVSLSGQLASVSTYTLTPPSSPGGSYTLQLIPNKNQSGTGTVTISVMDQPANGQPGNTTTESFSATIAATHLPIFNGPAPQATISENSGLSYPYAFNFTDADGSTPTVTITSNSQPSWLSASVGSYAAPTAPTAHYLAVTPATNQAGVVQLDIHAVDAAGAVFDQPLTVNITPLDYPETVSGGAFTVPDLASGASYIGTLSIASNDMSAAAAALGYDTLGFSVTGYSFAKNGAAVGAPASGPPVTIVQNASNRGVAYVYVNNSSDFNWLTDDSVTVQAQGADGGGKTTNPLTLSLSIPDTHIWSPSYGVTTSAGHYNFLNFVGYYTVYDVSVSTPDTQDVLNYVITLGSPNGSVVGSGTVQNGQSFYINEPPPANNDTNVSYFFQLRDTYGHTVDGGPYAIDPGFIKRPPGNGGAAKGSSGAGSALPSPGSGEITGQAATADTLTGTTGADYFDGQGAPPGTSDVEVGDGGNDVYVFDPGYGLLTINNASTVDTGPHGTLLLGLTASQESSVWFERSGNDLLILLTGSSDQVTVSGWYASPTSQLASITLADGSTISAEDVDQLRLTMDVYRGANPSFSPAAQMTLTDPTNAALVARAISVYWSAPTAAVPGQAIPISPGPTPTTATGGANGTVFVLTGGAAVNWPPASGPAVSLPANEPTVGLSVGGFSNDVVTVDPSVTAPVFINGGTAFADISGGQGADWLVSAANGGELIAGSGADNLYASGNAEMLVGGAGQDTLASGAGALNAYFMAGAGADTIQGDGLNATASYARSTSGVNVNLATGVGFGGFATGDRLSGVTNLVGSAFNDTLEGAGGGSSISGGGGNDVLIGNGANDTLNGTGGIATASYITSPAGVTVNLATGTASDGFGGTDTLIDISNAVAPNFASRLVGNTANNILTGGTGNDTLDGGGGNDTLVGGGGNDTYLFAAADGQLVIQNGLPSGSPNASGILELASGDLPGTLWFTQSGSDLLIQRIGSASQVLVSDWFAASGTQLSSITMGNGQALTPAQVTSQALAMTAFQAQTGFNPVSFSSGTATVVNATGVTFTVSGGPAALLALGGADTINGGSGGSELLLGSNDQSYVTGASVVLGSGFSGGVQGNNNTVAGSTTQAINVVGNGSTYSGVAASTVTCSATEKPQPSVPPAMSAWLPAARRSTSRSAPRPSFLGSLRRSTATTIRSRRVDRQDPVTGPAASPFI